MACLRFTPHAECRKTFPILSLAAFILLCTSVQGASVDKAALLALKAAFVDNTGLALSSWTSSYDPCDVYNGYSGVTCNDQQRVTALDLTSRKLGGTLSSQIGNLTALNVIQLTYNSVGGALPAELGLIKNLTSLYAANNNLSGSLPRELANAAALAQLQLSSNKLIGPIPQEYSQFTALTLVDLSGNNLTGSVPSSFIRPGVTYDFSSTNLCSSVATKGLAVCGSAPTTGPTAAPTGPTSGPSAAVGLIPGSSLAPSNAKSSSTDSGSGSSSSVGAIAGAIAAVVVVLAIGALLAFIVYKRRKNKKASGEPMLPLNKPSVASNGSVAAPINEHPSVQGGLPDSYVSNHSASSAGVSVSTPVGVVWLTMDQLAEATGGFSAQNLLGQGGFGKVYKGKLEDGSAVAVKILAGHSQGEREFRAEVDNLSRIQHRHLVKLRACAAQGSERALVYDFAPNGTLEAALHCTPPGAPPLGWATRVKVAAGAAKGLAYLHEDVEPRIIHRDVKGSNILLDRNMDARVADFGLARVVDEAHSYVSTRVMGTFGYLAPEYFTTAQLSPASDTYSFGVVLLELITGRRPMDFSGTPPDANLVEYTQNMVTNTRCLELLDPRLQDQAPPQEVLATVSVAVQCVQKDHTKRPKMSQVARMLENLEETWSQVSSCGGLAQLASLQMEGGVASSISTDSIGLMSTHSTLYSEDSMAGVTKAFPEKFEQGR